MGQITLKSKTHLGDGNYEYKFACFCSPKPVREIAVTTGNDNEAYQMAQNECDSYCDNDNAHDNPKS